MLDLLEPLHVMVVRHFQAAKKSTSLVFSDTELVEVLTSRGVPFQIRYCAALRKKPKEGMNGKENKPKLDPFESPAADLLVAEVPKTNPSHVIVLNKYPVIKNHFILATKTSKPQTALLELDDLSIAYACVQAWERDAPIDQPRRLFAFFNSGSHSGASQAHRHLQFLPVEDMEGDQKSDWRPLLDGMSAIQSVGPKSLLHSPDLPFRHYALRVSAQNLYSNYILLLQAAIFGSKANSENAKFDGNGPLEHDGEAIISYNLALTSDMMAICPRRTESAEMNTSGEATSTVAINGTVLGGTLMVKEENEWRSLRENPALLDDILSTIGYPVSKNKDLEQTKL